MSELIISEVDSKWRHFIYYDYLDVLNNEVDNLPPGVSISTMCSTCNLTLKNI